jgi:hypothetical protein
VVRRCIMKLSLAVMVIILLLGATSFVQASPAQGDETVVPAYGAEANPTGNPIGGGDGYVSPHGYTQATADYVVTTVTQLSTALSSATAGQVIWIPSGTTITISTDYGKTLKSGVVLASNRGQDGAAGGKILWTYEARGFMQPILYCQSNSVVSGLVLQGPGGICGASGYNEGNCALRGANGALRIEVENCEISDFANGGIYFYGGGMAWDSSNRHWVHHCNIYNIQRDGFGYGVSEEGGCSFLVECCIFNACRHEIMGQSTDRSETPNNYELRYNIFYDSWYWSSGVVGGNDDQQTQVDFHGSGTGTSTWSGDVLSIHHNTFSSNDSHSWSKTNVGIRGIVKTECRVYNNWTKKTTHSGLYTETVANDAFSCLTSDGGETRGTLLSTYNMSVYDNWYGTTPPPGVSPNSPPATPSTPSGTTSGQVGTAHTYQAVTTDPDGNQIRYAFDWGDGTSSTTDLLNSGVTASVSHTWTVAGDYYLYVQATDSHGAVSSRSYPGLRVTIVDSGQPLPTPNSPPATPATPSGPISGQAGTAYTYQAMTTDLDGNAMQYTFNWGDDSTSTTELLDSGVTASVSHAWTRTGDYWLYVQATDSRGAASSRSNFGLHVKVVSPFQPSSVIPNNAPATPGAPSGTTTGLTSTDYQYLAMTTDPDADTLLYTFDWGDGMSSTTELLNSGVTASVSHAWAQPGAYAIQVKATDAKGAISASSSAVTVNVLNQSQAAQAEPATPAPATPVPAVPAPATPVPPAAAPAQGVSAAVTPTVEKPTESSPVGPSNATVENADGSLSPAGRGSPSGGPQRSGFVWWLLSVSVIVGAAVLLTGAIVRDTIPKNHPDGEGSGNR